MAALEVIHAGVRYGGVTAVADVSLAVEHGSVLTLLGANGAGKTSLLRGISGLVAATGEVVLAGRNIARLGGAARAKAGLGHVLEGRHVFADLTVAENLQLGALLAADPDAAVKTALDLLPELTPMLERKAGRLSGGQQQMLAMARALSATPKVLLLDEPTNGLAPLLVKRTIEVIRGICELGVGVVLVEQRLDVAQALDCDVLILQRGRVVGSGRSTEEDMENRIHAIYLG